jgi:elongation factor G
MHANRSESIDSLSAGDIGVIVGMKLAQTGDTVGSEGFPVLLESMSFPEPVISVAIEPKTMSDMDKLKGVLETLMKEDPTFTVKENAETGQLIISGMGELHLDVLVTRIIKDFKVEARIGNPQVSYRESITTEMTHSEKFQKVLAGKENTAGVTLTVKPLPRGTGNQFTSTVKHGTVPDEIIEAVKRGVEGAFASGVMFGYPLYDVGAQLTDIEYNELTASDFAFEAAASMGLDNACRSANPVMLEPIMKVDIFVPKDYIGEVISNLTSRGGIVHSMESRPSIEHIKAEAPLVKLFGYSTALRSATQGRGTFAMEFSHFAQKTGK